MEETKIEKELNTIRETIRVFRLKRGYSQEYMGQLLNISQYAYHKIENGKTRLHIENLLKIASALEINSKQLFED